MDVKELSDEAVREIRQRTEAGQSHEAIALKFNLTAAQVKGIATGRTRKSAAIAQEPATNDAVPVCASCSDGEHENCVDAGDGSACGCEDDSHYEDEGGENADK